MKKIFKLMMLLSLLFTYLIAESLPKSCKYYDEMSSYDYLRGLIRTSSYDFASWHRKSSEINFWVDSDNDGVALIKIYMDTDGDGTGTMGWLEYYHDTFRLFNVMPNNLNPKELTYDNDWRDVVKTVFSDKQLEFVIFKKKTSLYDTTTFESKPKKFLIKDDCAFVIAKKTGWHKIYFYHTKWKTSTMMWIKDNDLEKHSNTVLH